MAKKKPVKKKPTKKTPVKNKPTKKSPVKKTPGKRTPRKRAKSKETPSKKERKKGVIGSAIGKIPESYKVKGGKSKYKTKYGESTVEYEEVDIGK